MTTTNKAAQEDIQSILQSLNLFLEAFQLIKPFYLDDYLQSLDTVQAVKTLLESLEQSQDVNTQQLESAFEKLMFVRKKLPIILTQFNELTEAFGEDVDALKADLKTMGGTLAQILWQRQDK